jgi:hypothetical protein
MTIKQLGMFKYSFNPSSSRYAVCGSQRSRSSIKITSLRSPIVSDSFSLRMTPTPCSLSNPDSPVAVLITLSNTVKAPINAMLPDFVALSKPRWPLSSKLFEEHGQRRCFARAPITGDGIGFRRLCMSDVVGQLRNKWLGTKCDVV